MPITTTPATTEEASLEAQLAMLDALRKGEINGDVPTGSYNVVVKTAVVYKNPMTNKTSYRLSTQIADGAYKGAELTVFTSVFNLKHLADMANALKLNSTAHNIMLLKRDPAILREMQGRTATVVVEPKDGESGKTTNNWPRRAV